MTSQEFKAWFDGFTEALDGVPSKAQWARIKARVGEIDGKPVTERIYIDRYLPQCVPPRWPYWSTYTGSAGNVMTGLSAVGQNVSNNLNAMNQRQEAFCSSNAMVDIGRADARALAS